MGYYYPILEYFFMSKRNPWDNKRVICYLLLKETRKNYGITQIELARRLDKPQSFVSKYENGERILDLVEIYQICLALRASFTDFMQIFDKKIQKQ